MGDLIDKILEIKWETIFHVNQKTNYEISENGMARNKTTNKILTPAKTQDGFYQITLIVDGKRITKKVHNLVAEAFLPNPKHRKRVRHIDGNKLNNNLKNLEWAGPLKGISKPFPQANNKIRCGEDALNNKYSEEQIIGVCSLLSEGNITNVDVSRITGVPSKIVSKIKNRKLWRHISESYF